MTRLERIWQLSKRVVFEDDTSSLSQADDDGTFNNSLQLIDLPSNEGSCRFCRTYANDVGSDECPMCLAMQQERVRIAKKAVSSKLEAANIRALAGSTFRTMQQENRSLHRIKHSKHETRIPLVARLDLRLDNQIPRLFVIVPVDLKHGWKHPKTWLRRPVATKYQLFFIFLWSHLPSDETGNQGGCLQDMDGQDCPSVGC